MMSCQNQSENLFENRVRLIYMMQRQVTALYECHRITLHNARQMCDIDALQGL